MIDRNRNREETAMADWRKNAVHTVEVTGYTAEGLGVARLEGRVIFIPGTIRGRAGRSSF